MEIIVKKRWLILAALTTGLMTLTNPSKEAYVEHLVWELKDLTCQQQPLLSPSLQLSCATLNTVPPGMTMVVLNSYSRRQNFLPQITRKHESHRLLSDG